MFTIPLALIGVVVALLVTGKPVSLPILIGFVMLGGIAVNNGIVMVDYINQLKRRGVEKKEAILQASSVRLRPVLITALTTVLGMLPMAIDASQGSEMRAPMAITVIGGLIATTFLTLYVIEPDGRVSLSEVVDAPYGVMMHDVAITGPFDDSLVGIIAVRDLFDGRTNACFRAVNDHVGQGKLGLLGRLGLDTLPGLLLGQTPLLHQAG